MSWHYLLIAAAVAIVGITVYGYGDARYEAGRSAAMADCVKAEAKAVTDAANTAKSIAKDVEILDADSVDAELRSLGVMRPDHDR